MPTPPLGTFKIEAGNGTNVGTVMTLQCPFLYRAVSGGLISCEQGNSGAQWTGSIPDCKRKTHTEAMTQFSNLP